MAEGLTERERDLLAFEKQWWRYQGAKETAVRDLFDISMTRYVQLLNVLIDKPAALEVDPVLVNRLRRIRDERRQRGHRHAVRP